MPAAAPAVPAAPPVPPAGPVVNQGGQGIQVTQAAPVLQPITANQPAVGIPASVGIITPVVNPVVTFAHAQAAANAAHDAYIQAQNVLTQQMSRPDVTELAGDQAAIAHQLDVIMAQTADQNAASTWDISYNDLQTWAQELKGEANNNVADLTRRLISKANELRNREDFFADSKAVAIAKYVAQQTIGIPDLARLRDEQIASQRALNVAELRAADEMARRLTSIFPNETITPTSNIVRLTMPFIAAAIQDLSQSNEPLML